MDFEIEDQASEEVGELFSNFEQQVIDNKSIEQLAGMYRMVYDDVEYKTKELQKLSQKKTALAEQFCKVLLSEGFDQIKTEHGSFAPKVDPQISIMKEHEDKAFEVLEEQGLGANIKRAINWQTLNKLYKDGALVVSEDTDVEIFKTWKKHGIRMRRSNA